MKILHVIPSIDRKSGGPSKAVLNLSRLGQQFGAKITIACTNEGLGQKSFEDSLSELNDYATVNYFDFIGNHSFKYSRSLHIWLKKNVPNFDVVHLHAAFSFMTTIAARQCQKAQIPYIFRPLGTLSQASLSHKSSLLKRWYYNLFEHNTLKKAKVIHTTSQAECDEIQKLVTSNVTIVPVMCVGLTKHEGQVFNSKYFDADNLQIGYLGRIHPKKNLELLFKALADSSFQEYKWSLSIAGEGNPDYIANLKSLISSLNIEQNVRWMGFIDGESKQAFLSSLDLFISPSLHENFGISAVEAMASHIPCILTKTHEFLSEKAVDTCIFCDMSPESISNAIHKFRAMSHDDRSNMVTNAFDYVSASFGCDSVSKKLHDMYEQAISN